MTHKPRKVVVWPIHWRPALDATRFQQPYLVACGAVITLRVLPEREAWDWWPCTTSSRCQGHELLLQSQKTVVKAWNCKNRSSRNVQCTKYMCHMGPQVAALLRAT